MCPTIRIDEEVYGWLQAQAVPFEDNPNSVLRRLAGFPKNLGVKEHKMVSEDGDKISRKRAYAGRRPPLARGDDLIERWKLPVRQARFHRDGDWYEHLTEFPAALCDRNGYVIFETEHEMRTIPALRLGKQVEVSGGISALAGYRKVGDTVQELIPDQAGATPSANTPRRRKLTKAQLEEISKTLEY